MSNIPYHLDDWLTTPEMPFYSKLTNGGDDVLHDHTFFEIFYILEGNISHELNGALMQLRAGDIVFYVLRTDIFFFAKKTIPAAIAT